MTKIFKILLVALFLPLISHTKIEFNAYDTPNDKGESLDLEWKILDEELLENTKTIYIYRSDEDFEFKQIKFIDPSENFFSDKENLKDFTPYYYYLEFRDENDLEIYTSNTYGPYMSEPQWFDKSQIATLVSSIFSMIIILLFISLAKKGKKLYVRPLPGVKAIEDAVGRATEMGKPCVYSTGIGILEEVPTLASLCILSKVSETIAEYNSKLIVPNFDPIVYTVTDEIIKSSYLKTGRPDAYRPENVYFLTNRQFAYAMAVSGLMAREKPAANFFLGRFMAESLILAESGSMTGAIQIAGTDSISQIPFFIVACDYTLIGEELYAAGAYMGDDPKLIGGLKEQDYVKLAVMASILILFLARILGVPGITTLLTGGK